MVGFWLEICESRDIEFILLKGRRTKNYGKAANATAADLNSLQVRVEIRDPSPAFAKLSLAAVRTSASQSPKRLTTLATTWPGGWQKKWCWEKSPWSEGESPKIPASKKSQRLGKMMTFYFWRFLEGAEKMKKSSSKDIEAIPFKPSWGSLTKVIPWMCFVSDLVHFWIPESTCDLPVNHASWLSLMEHPAVYHESQMFEELLNITSLCRTLRIILRDTSYKWGYKSLPQLPIYFRPFMGVNKTPLLTARGPSCVKHRSSH